MSMGINVYGEKTEENHESVIYKYGDDYEIMPGVFKYYKTLESEYPKVDIIKNFRTDDNKNCQYAFRLCARIRDYLKKNGKYPDKIEHHS